MLGNVPGDNPPGPLLLREVSKMRIVFLDADDVRIRFEAACNRLGEGDARRAFSMALNKEGRKSFTTMRRALSQQSSIPRGAVNAAMRFKGATSSCSPSSPMRLWKRRSSRWPR